MIGKILQKKRKEPIRICVLIDAWVPVWGGGQKHVWEIAQKLVQKHNYCIDIFVPALIDERGNVFASSESYYQGRLRIIRVGIPTHFSNLVGRVSWILMIIQEVVKRAFNGHHYDIIHGQAFLPAIPTKIISHVLKRKSFFTVHGSFYLDTSPHTFLGKIERWLLTEIPFTQVISVSKHFIGYQNINKHISFIPNGVNLKKFDQHKNNKNKIFTYLWVGRFDKVKALDILIESFKQVIKKRNARLVLIGDGVDKIRINDLIKTFQLAYYIKIISQLPENKLINYYKSADVFVLPSLSEGCPLTLFEAWAARCPVIATAVGDNCIYIEEGLNGYLCAPKNTADLTIKMIKAYDNKLLKTLGIRGYHKIKKNYSWDQIASQHDQLYHRYI